MLGGDDRRTLFLVLAQDLHHAEEVRFAVGVPVGSTGCAVGVSARRRARRRLALTSMGLSGRPNEHLARVIAHPPRFLATPPVTIEVRAEPALAKESISG